MKNPVSNIALWMLLVFSITFLPFNLMHHHAEDEHILVRHQGKTEKHHCELDDHFCQPGIQKNCEHNEHIARTIGKCFSCEFHFIKHFHHSPFGVDADTQTFVITSQPVCSGKLLMALVLLTNKGPPAIT